MNGGRADSTIPSSVEVPLQQRLQIYSAIISKCNRALGIDPSLNQKRIATYAKIWARYKQADGIDCSAIEECNSFTCKLYYQLLGLRNAKDNPHYLSLKKELGEYTDPVIEQLLDLYKSEYGGSLVVSPTDGTTKYPNIVYNKK